MSRQDSVQDQISSVVSELRQHDFRLEAAWIVVNQQSDLVPCDHQTMLTCYSVANRLGCYDAADLFERWYEDAAKEIR